jgi:AmmeMemoRadiSam system protein A
MWSPLNPHSEEDRRTLLQAAREAIRRAVVNRELPHLPIPAGRLSERGAMFVTLHREGKLRGCIGQLDPAVTLLDGVARCAIAAALDDPRFDPVAPSEIDELEIEISLLSPFAAVRPEEVEVGRHGLLIRQGMLRGLLLPQVATEYHWTRERFLEETCRKAGLPRDAWKAPETQLECFTAEVFSEKEVARL